jgi:signal transduction histidine kinase
MDADVVRLLLVDDNEGDAVLIADQLCRGGTDVRYDRVDTAGTMIAALDCGTPRAGAQDFALKGDLARLAPEVQRELRSAKAHREEAKDRRALERQLHQADRLDSVGELAGGIAHDFNNLLGVINGYAEFVLAELPDDHPCRREPGSPSTSLGHRSG